MYDKLVAKLNYINTIGFILKTKYGIDKLNLEKKIIDGDKKIPDPSGLVKKTNYNVKITEKENKMPRINGLPTITALTAVKNKILDVSLLVKKNKDYNAEILEINLNMLLQLITINLEMNL